MAYTNSTQYATSYDDPFWPMEAQSNSKFDYRHARLDWSDKPYLTRQIRSSSFESTRLPPWQQGYHDEDCSIRTPPEFRETHYWTSPGSFHTYTRYKGLNCKVFIEKDSCSNTISLEAVSRFSLKPEPHPNPYDIVLEDQTRITVDKRCLFPIPFGPPDRPVICNIWCNILDIDMKHVELGKPWIEEFNVRYISETNSYILSTQGRKILIKPSPPRESRAKPTQEVSQNNSDTRVERCPDIPLSISPENPITIVSAPESSCLPSAESKLRSSPSWNALFITPRMTLFILSCDSTHLVVVVHFRTLPLIGLGLPIVRGCSYFPRIPLRISFQISLERILDSLVVELNLIESKIDCPGLQHLESHYRHFSFRSDLKFPADMSHSQTPDMSMFPLGNFFNFSDFRGDHVDHVPCSLACTFVYPCNISFAHPYDTSGVLRMRINSLIFPLHGHRSYSPTYLADNTRKLKIHVFTHLVTMHPPLENIR